MKAIKVDIRGMHEELKDTSLKGLQEAVGGYVEPVYLRVKPYEYMGKKYDIMLANEDGHAMELMFNQIATDMYEENTKPYTSHYIVGDVVFTTSEVWN